MVAARNLPHQYLARRKSGILLMAVLEIKSSMVILRILGTVVELCDYLNLAGLFARHHTNEYLDPRYTLTFLSTLVLFKQSEAFPDYVHICYQLVHPGIAT